MLLSQILAPVLKFLTTVLGSRLSVILGSTLFAIYAVKEIPGALTGDPLSKKVEKAASPFGDYLLPILLGGAFFLIFVSRR